MPPTYYPIKDSGVDSPITKKSRGSRPHFGMLIFHNHTTKMKGNQTAFGFQMWLFIYKTGFWVTKAAFRLQRLSFHLQIWIFVLQSGISFYN